MPKRKQNAKSYEEKYEIINYSDANKGMKKKRITEKFAIGQSTLTDILKAREMIIECVQNPVDRRTSTLKRVKTISFSKALNVWFAEKRIINGVKLYGDMLLLKAQEFTSQFGYEVVLTPHGLTDLRKDYY